MGGAGGGVGGEVEHRLLRDSIGEGHAGLSHPELVAAMSEEAGHSIGEASLRFAIRADVAQ